MTKTLLILAFALATSGVVAQDTVTMTICKQFWKNGEPINGDGFSLEEYDPSDPVGSGLLFVVDSNTNCMDMSFFNLAGYPPDYVRCFDAYKDDNYLNGVTVLDLIAISKHILGLEPLPSPYSMIAADANLSGSITTFDIVLLRSFLLGAAMPQNPSWRFFRETCQFPNPFNPFDGSSCPCIVNTEMPDWDGDTLNIIGVKSGDVDGDAMLNGQFAGPPTIDSVVLVLPDITLDANAPVTVPVSFEGNADLIGMQVEFQFDTSKIHLDNISGSAFIVNTSSWLQLPGGRFRLVLFDQSNPVAEGNTLFNLHLTAFESVALHDAIQIIKTSLSPVAAVSGQDAALKIVNKFSGSVAVQNPATNSLNIGTANPNPFVDKTYIRINLEKSETVHMEISDMTGRRLYATKVLLDAGNHRIEIPSSGIAPGNIFFYKIQAGQEFSGGKIIRLK